MNATQSYRKVLTMLDSIIEKLDEMEKRLERASQMETKRAA